MLNNIIYSPNPNKKASYITEDGRFINLSENKFNLIGYADREPVHSDMPIDANTTIRLNDGTYLYIAEEAYVELPINEPNKRQYQALLKWFDFLMLNSKKRYVCIGINCRSERFEFINKVNKQGLLPEDLIKEVKKLYKNV